MMRKRIYPFTLDEEAMKELPIRRFTTVVGYLTEDTVITKDGSPIGVYRPLNKDTLSDTDLSKIWEHLEEVPMDESVKKAIEPDKAQVKRGAIRKGLGDLPGETLDRKPTLEQRDPYKEFQPVPKK